MKITNLIPQSIGSRLLFSLIFVLCIVQIISLLAFYLDSYQANNRFAERMSTLRIAGVINAFDKISPLNYEDYLVSQHHQGLFFYLSDKAVFTNNSNISNLSVVHQIKEELSNENHHIEIKSSMTDDEKKLTTTGCLELRPLANPHRLSKRCKRLTEALDKHVVSYVGSVKTPNNRYLNFICFKAPNPPLHLGKMCIITVITLTILGTFAIYTFIKITIKPLNKLTEQTDKLSQNYKNEPLIEEGATEILNLIRSFNRMQKKITDFISDRTRILASISHDLKTPLTSMALRAEFLPESEDKDKLIKNIETMSTMVKATLQFARSEQIGTTIVPINLNAFINDVVKEYIDNGKEITYRAIGPNININKFMCSPIDMHRILQNLIDNALTYGKKAHITLEEQNNQTKITIADEGRGIPIDKLESVFAPFMRLDSARNTTEGHSGLGLAIVRNMILKQGGSIQLTNIKPHGLAAIITYLR